jgi:hypothetical protein
MAATASVSWGNSTDSVNADLDWNVPSGEWLPINRCGSSNACAETGTVPIQNLPDGLHWIEAYVDGYGGSWTDVSFAVSFPCFEYKRSERLQTDVYQGLALDVQDGCAHLVFNGWVPSDDPLATNTAGLHLIEVGGSWRNSTGGINGDLTLILPTGEPMEMELQHGSAWQGFERIVVDDDRFTDGLYQLNYGLVGNNGPWTDATLVAEFPSYRFRVDRRIQANLFRTIGVDVKDGLARVIFNGWLEPDEGGSGDLTGVHPVEVNAGWRNATGSVNADISLTLPDGGKLPVWRNGSRLQGFERINWPDGVPITDGTYRLDWFIVGNNGPWVDVVYQVKFLDWTYRTSRRLQADKSFTITLQVLGGAVNQALVSNTWE